MTATMEVESYALLDEIALEAAQFLTEVQEGLDEQTRRLGLYTPRTASVASAQALFGDFMSAKEQRVWATFLPSRHSRASGQWVDFDPDKIPSVAKDAIDLALGSGVFDDLQIWTAAPQDIDPMVVGVVRESGRAYYFRVVRWAEALAPFEAIETAVELRKQFVRAILIRFTVAAASAALMAATVLCFLVPAYLAVWIAGGFVLLLLALVLNFYPERRENLQQKAISQCQVQLAPELHAITLAAS